MSVHLPNLVNYLEGLPALPPNTTQIPVACAPVNGSSFIPGSQIQCDLLNRGFLIPDSMYIDYTYTVANAATKLSDIKGVPVYSPFVRLDTQIGSQTVETIQNYGVIMNMLANVTMDVAQKYGMQYAFGYFASAGVPSLEQLDGRICTNAETGSFSAPLMCALSNAEKLIPLFAMPQIRLSLTMDSLTNFMSAGTTGDGQAPTNFTITNFEIRYKVVDFGPDVENMVRQMAQDKPLYIKSQSFASSNASIASGVSGSQSLVFNQRYASLKSIFAINGGKGPSATANGSYDSVDLTSNNGDYCFNVGGIQYPQKVISTSATRKAQAFMELKSAVGSIFDKSNNMAINSIEFAVVSNADTVTTAPAKFYVGTSLEKLNSDSLLTGISTQNSPINYNINLGTATAAASNITLVVNYDALFEVDVANRGCIIKA